jgi:protein NrfD
VIPDTYFSASPHWGWLITLYFFVGGIAGGALFVAAMLHFARTDDRGQVRRGHYIAFAGALISGLLLTVDLTRPLRFWHMLFQPDGTPMFKPWSPMSVGAWGLMAFSGVAMLSALGSASEEGRIRWKAPARLASGLPASILALAGAVSGLFLAGYTGVLLVVTNRPIWSDSTWLGALFLLSGVSTAVATLMLTGDESRMDRSRDVSSVASGHWLIQFDRRIKVLELLVIVAFVVSLGTVAGALVSVWGVLLLLGVVGLGILVPLFLEHRRRGSSRPGIRIPVFVLVGGLLLRAVIVFGSESIRAPATTIAGG